MTLNISDNNWAKAGLGLALLLLLTGLWAYLAGGVFLMIYGRQFEEATPITLYQYWVYYGNQESVVRWLYASMGGAAVLVLAPFLILLAPAKRSLFGDARFARPSEIKKAGLLGDKGLIVGRLGRRYLMYPGQQHVILSAPTRSGKGVGIVIPNLLNWPDSVVVLDVKQENWDITSGFRQRHGQECYLFNPAAADYRTHRYNPLSYISPDPNFRIDDVQKIGNMLFPDQPGTDVIWTATPRSLFLGIVLYLLETPGKPVTIGQVLRETLEDGDGAAYFAKIINQRTAAGKPLSPACIRGLNSYISISSDNTRSGIIGGFRSRLELWMNPLVDAATSANDFDLRNVRKRRMSIYLGVTPDNLERMAPLLNLFFQQLIDLNTRELPNQNKAIKYTCLLLMDEFTAIGKIPILSKGISYIAGYWLRMMPIIQSPAQTVEVYGEAAAQTFQTNHALQIVYPPSAKEIKTANEISEWLGYQTVKGKSVSKSKNLLGKKTPTESTSDQRRALLLPQEITRLGKARELVVMEDVPPILAQKVVYFRDNVFMDRLKMVSRTLKDLGKKLPTKDQLDAVIERGELAAPVPLIDVEGHIRAVSGDAPLTVAVPEPAKTATVTTKRAVTAEDLPNFSKLNFDLDFSGVVKPAAEAGALDEDALRAYADDLCRAAGINVAR
jgi:type IV secretion system protein VirD4